VLLLQLLEKEMGSMSNRRQQVVTGLVPPLLGEAKIREAWPSVAAFPAVATLGRKLMQTIVLAPLGWLVLIVPYFLKVLPGFARRYTLTNRRLMIRRGLKAIPSHEVPLAEIEDVRIREDHNTPFFRAATLEILSKGRVVLTLPGVPGPEAFRHAILNAAQAWVPGKAATGQFIPASASKKA
jgi:hypothetical protein